VPVVVPNATSSAWSKRASGKKNLTQRRKGSDGSEVEKDRIAAKERKEHKECQLLAIGTLSKHTQSIFQFRFFFAIFAIFCGYSDLSTSEPLRLCVFA
jgi:hypothetical protein